MTVLRRIIHRAAIVLNVIWLARSVWSVWGLVNWAHLLNNPFGYGHGWIVWASFLTPLLAIVALLWSFGWSDEPVKARV